MKRFARITGPSAGRRHLACGLLALSVSFVTGCVQRTEPVVLSFNEVPSPAAPGSGEPNLFVAEDDRLYMSWLERTGEGGHALKFSVRGGDRWAAPRTVATGNTWFVNWADFPSVVASKKGALAAHWLAKSGGDPYAYDIHVARSRDGGETWSRAFKPHTDRTRTEHGFVSMLPWSDDRVLLVWLDGREFATAADGGAGEAAGGDGDGGGSENSGGPENSVGGEHESDPAAGEPGPKNEMTLRAAVMDGEGRLYDERRLDERVCDCCQTSGVRTPNGAVFAYRDRSPDEVRDISVVRVYKGEWQVPQQVSGDGWKIPGCPVNGPQLAAYGKRVVLAWFTNAGDSPRVRVAFSKNEGATFGAPVVADDGDPMGRIAAAMLTDGSALVCWMEYVDDGAQIRLRRVRPDGTREPSITLATSSRERAAGFPQMARAGKEILLAWTVPGEPSSIKTAAATLDR
ncbi:MAG: sialidase family protein [Candidatus Krumholzibacteriia bacterium]